MTIKYPGNPGTVILLICEHSSLRSQFIGVMGKKAEAKKRRGEEEKQKWRAARVKKKWPKATPLSSPLIFLSSHLLLLNACGEGLDNSLQKMLLSHYSTIPLFQYSGNGIVNNGMKAKRGNSYYQRFVEIPGH